MSITQDGLPRLRRNTTSSRAATFLARSTRRGAVLAARPGCRRWSTPRRTTPRATSSCRSSCAAAPTGCRWSCRTPRRLLHVAADDRGAAARRDQRSPRNRAVNLDGFFGLPPAMASLLPAYQAGQLLVVHAAGLNRSDALAFRRAGFMEVGVPGTRDIETGWLGRHLASKPPMKAGRRPARDRLQLRASADAGRRARHAADPRSGELRPLAARPRPTPRGWPGSAPSFGGAARSAARPPRSTRSAPSPQLSTIDISAYQPSGGAVYPTSSFGTALRSTAALIRADVGVEAVQIDIGGWDTHSAQDPVTGGMATTMRDLADALAAFHADMVGASRHRPAHAGDDVRVRAARPRRTAARAPITVTAT